MPEEAKDGLILVDGSALDPLAVRGTPLRGHPFVFLNACQVGRGSQILGDHAGLAAAFLFAGASGVVAPLWSIDDRLARQIAVRFYERAMRGEAPAEVLRTERAAFRDAPETTSSTYMAYQFFGHPGLRLEPEAGLTVSAGGRSRPGRASAGRRRAGSRDLQGAAPGRSGLRSGGEPSSRPRGGAESPFATSERAKARA